MRKFFLILSGCFALSALQPAAAQAPDSPAVKEAVKEAVKAEAISAEAVVAADAPVGSEVAVADTIAVTIQEQYRDLLLGHSLLPSPSTKIANSSNGRSLGMMYGFQH